MRMTGRGRGGGQTIQLLAHAGPVVRTRSLRRLSRHGAAANDRRKLLSK